MSVAQISVNCPILAAQSGCNKIALKSVFLKGLSEEKKDELSTWDEPDYHLQERQRDCRVVTTSPPRNKLQHNDPTPPVARSAAAEPMQLGQTWVATQKWSQLAQKVIKRVDLQKRQGNNYSSDQKMTQGVTRKWEIRT